MTYSGQTAAIIAAICWSFGALAFASAGRRIGAFRVNLIRIVLAVPILLLVHWFTLGSLWPLGLSSVQLRWLLLSGFVGLALGDLCYFACIAMIGPRVGSLLMATAPMFSAYLGWVLLDERLDARAVVAVSAILTGVYLVLVDPRREKDWGPPLSGRTRLVAIGLGLLGGVGQAAGSVLAKLAKPGLGSELPELAAISATLLRMVGGMAGIVAVAACSKQFGKAWSARKDGKAMQLVCIAVALGPTLGVWLSMYAILNTRVVLAQTLLSLTPVFMLPIAYFAYRARPSRTAIFGTLLAFVGTALLMLAQHPG